MARNSSWGGGEAELVIRKYWRHWLVRGSLDDPYYGNYNIETEVLTEGEDKSTHAWLADAVDCVTHSHTRESILLHPTCTVGFFGNNKARYTLFPINSPTRFEDISIICRCNTCESFRNIISTLTVWVCFVVVVISDKSIRLLLNF